MSDVLGRIDNALDDLCPCGADPRPDSAYCSYDCEPNHRSTHSQAEHDGTQMRWRPDLVTAQDDTDLTPFDHPTLYGGPRNAQIFERPDGRLHLRLDDGHRYVGCDIPADTYWAARETSALDDRWASLERELGNTRHLEPEQPRTWAGYDREFISDDQIRSTVSHDPIGVALTLATAGETVSVQLWGQPEPVRAYLFAPGIVNVLDFGADPTGQTDSRTAIQTAVDSAPPGATVIFPPSSYSWGHTDSNPLADILACASGRVTEIFDGVRQGIEHQIRSWAQPTTDAAGQPPHPMLAAIEARRHRNTGPTQRPRAPRNLGPRQRR